MNGLVLCLDAANRKSYPGIGTAWTNLVGSGIGTLTNGPTYSDLNNGYIDFDGTDDHAPVSLSALNLEVGTIEVWVKADAPTDNLNQQIFARTNTSAGTFNIFKNTINLFQFAIRLSDNIQYSIGSDSIATTNWTHIVGTYDGTIQRMFVNSVQQSTTNSISGTLNTGGTLLVNIGSQTTAAAFFNGKISTIKLYNRALTESEVKQNFNALRGRFGI